MFYAVFRLSKKQKLHYHMRTATHDLVPHDMRCVNNGMRFQ